VPLAVCLDDGLTFQTRLGKSYRPTILNVCRRARCPNRLITETPLLHHLFLSGLVPSTCRNQAPQATFIYKPLAFEHTSKHLYPGTKPRWVN
jgi:hypothetical protein